jgi:hypothetical protein
LQPTEPQRRQKPSKYVSSEISNSFEYDADERQPWERTASTGYSSGSIYGLAAIVAWTAEKAMKTGNLEIWEVGFSAPACKR